MTTSIDGKATGDFLSHPVSSDAIDVYYQINRDYKVDSYACGRITMQGSFCGEDYPDLSKYKPVHHDLDLKMDFILDDMTGFYAVAFDPHGRLGLRKINYSTTCVI